MANDIQRVGVVGLGTMGAGIAQVCVQAGVEAVVEELGAKREIFAELDRLLPSAVLATNTSALPVGEIAAATGRPDRVVGMHFFNPAPVLPLVEVVQAEASSEEAVETAFAFAERIGKRPIRCRDTPG